jgi:hypothetical protein
MKDFEQVYQNRSIRVFISSTFIDMQDDRNYLVKYTFPKLRKLCEVRYVNWTDVDLRWGVTNEQVSEGKVLPICIEEIKKCRPFFIGLLGDRYGWIPDVIPAELLAKESWLSEQFTEGKSITEMEILHGVLNNPEMAKHAFFYFRDKKFSENQISKVQQDYKKENENANLKLKLLKTKIRTSGFPYHEDYSSLEELDQLVFNDFKKIIDELFPIGDKISSQELEDMEQYSGKLNHSIVYINRQDYFDKLESHLSANTDKPLVITGESGCGKTALLANWSLFCKKRHPEILLIDHYIGTTRQSSSIPAMLRRIMRILKNELNLGLEIPSDDNKLHQKFLEWLHLAADRKRVVIILDAVNQLVDQESSMELFWLPFQLPPNIRMVISTLPGGTLKELYKREYSINEIQLLNREEKERYIKSYLKLFSKELDSKQINAITAAPQSSNPLYLKILLDELKIFGIQEKLNQRIEFYLKTNNPFELFNKVIERWELDYESENDIVGETLSMIWASKFGLMESEILQLLGNNKEPLARVIWSPFYFAVVEHLIDNNGLLIFRHDSLRMAVCDSYLPTIEHQMKAYNRLADYFENKEMTYRKVNELPELLAKTSQWKKLGMLLSDASFIMHTQYQIIRKYWAQIRSFTKYSIPEFISHYQHNIEEVDEKVLFQLSELCMDFSHFEAAVFFAVEYYNKQVRKNSEKDIFHSKLHLAMLINLAGDSEYSLKLTLEIIEEARKKNNCKNLISGLIHQSRILYTKEIDQSIKLMLEAKKISLIHCQNYDLDVISFALGTGYWEKNEFKKSLDYYTKAENNRSNISPDIDTINAIRWRKADCYYKLSQFNEALNIFDELCDYYRKVGQSHWLLKFLQRKRNLYNKIRDYSDVDKIFTEEVEICKRLGNPIPTDPYKLEIDVDNVYNTKSQYQNQNVDSFSESKQIKKEVLESLLRKTLNYKDAILRLKDIPNIDDSTMNIIGVCHLRLGEYAQAKKIFLQLARGNSIGWREEASFVCKKNFITTLLCNGDFEAFSTAIRDLENNEQKDSVILSLSEIYKKWKQDIRAKRKDIPWIKRIFGNNDKEMNTKIILNFEPGEF